MDILDGAGIVMLGYALYKTIRHVYAIPWEIRKLTHQIKDSRTVIRLEAARKLCKIARAIYGKDLSIAPMLGTLQPAIPALIEALDDPSVGVRANARGALEAFIGEQKSIRRLDALQSKLEQVGLHQARKRPSDFGMQPAPIERAGVVMMLTERKAELAREKDGELLAGETIRPCSRESHSAYRMTHTPNLIPPTPYLAKRRCT